MPGVVNIPTPITIRDDQGSAIYGIEPAYQAFPGRRSRCASLCAMPRRWWGLSGCRLRGLRHLSSGKVWGSLPGSSVSPLAGKQFRHVSFLLALSITNKSPPAGSVDSSADKE
jgi:hypothetical protein